MLPFPLAATAWVAFAAGAPAISPDLERQFLEMANAPTKERFLAVRKLVIESGKYEPDSDELSRARDLARDGKTGEAKDLLLVGRANLILSPRAHVMLMYIERKLGNADGAKLEAALGRGCVQAILSTGDGTKERPYLVTRVDDEPEVLKFLGMRSSGERRETAGAKTLDVITVEAGEVWFDVTDAVAHAKAAPPAERGGASPANGPAQKPSIPAPATTP